MPDKPDPPRATDAPAIPPWVSVVILFFVALGILYRLPRPAAITVQGWRMFAIFVCTVLGLMLRPLPGGAAVLIGIMVTMLTGVLTPAQALAGYSNTAVWLVIAAFLFSRAVINSGLARRLALLFIRTIGHTSLGLGYSLVACDVVMASVIPGNSARIGGILMPIGRTLSGIYQSTPGPTAGLLGTYLMLVLYQGDMLACAMYLTGQVSNPIAAGLALKTFNVSMTWSRWLQVSIVPGLVSFAVIPWFVYRMSPPGIRHTPEAAAMARDGARGARPADLRRDEGHCRIRPRVRPLGNGVAPRHGDGDRRAAGCDPAAPQRSPGLDRHRSRTHGVGRVHLVRRHRPDGRGDQ